MALFTQTGLLVCQGKLVHYAGGLTRGVNRFGPIHLSSDKPELLIFDCDGVLIDSEIISANTLIRLLRPLGVSIHLQYIRENFLGRSFPTVATSIRTDFDLELPPDFEMEYRRVLLDCFEEQLIATDGVINLLEKLKVPKCVATSSSPERVTQSLKIAALDRHFNGHVYTASEVTSGKPAPDLFLHVARSEGVDPGKCLVIEDSAPGVEAAEAAGMRVLRYIGGSHFVGARSELVATNKGRLLFDSWENFFEIVPALKPAQHHESVDDE